MHGRVKVRTSEEQAEAKRKEQQEKLKVYSTLTERIFAKKKNNELDEELLQITRGILEKNPDFYTFWNYRRETLLLLKDSKDLEELKALCLIELDLTQHCLKVNPKSYSAWHHRFWTMEFHPEADWKRELKLCNYFLSQDERNFHCWDYRRLVAKKCLVSSKEELDYSTKLIEANFSNYSAWHYRSKLLPIVHYDSVKKSIKEEVLLNEFELIQNAAFTDPDDQSVWFYHRWLLGKNKIPLQILNVSLVKPWKTVAVLFSEPLQVNNQNIKCHINGVSTALKWQSVCPDSPASTLWLGELPNDLVYGDGLSKITVSLADGQITSCLEGAHSTWKKCDRSNMFRSRLSAAAKDVLEKELDSCQQLNELEPNCKWTVFTCVLLMRALKDEKFDDQIKQFMEKLSVIDPMRKNYYKDLVSKFTVENVIEKLPVDAIEVNISNKNLCSLHHFDQFLCVEHVNLSSNCLSSIRPFKYLISLKTAILDDNLLADFKGVEHLKNLKLLSVQRNKIQKVSALDDLKSCSSFEELLIEENPIISEESYSSMNKAVYSFKISDGLN